MKNLLLILRKYIRLFYFFFKVSLMADLEYRANFATRILTDIFWYIAQVATFEVLYLHTPRVGTWDLEMTRIFLGSLFIVDAFFMLFFEENMSQLTQNSVRGDLDLILVKPVNSQFMISTRKMITPMLGNLLIATGYMAWAVTNYSQPVSFFQLLCFPLLAVCGVIILYACRFMFASLTIYFTKADSFQYLWFQFYRIAMKPDGIYPNAMRRVILSVLPLAAIASVPARSLLEPPDVIFYFYIFVLTALFLYLSHRFWNFMLKFYASASS